MTAIDLYIDFKSPASYLAVKPTRELAQASSVTVNWFPFDSKQQPLSAKKSDETRTETHFRVREEARREMHLRYAAVQGVPMRFAPVPGETRCALAALLWVSSAPESFIDAAFRAYWVDGADLDNADVVAGLLAVSGHDAGRFDAEAALSALADFEERTDEVGVIDAPMYVVAGQLFLGREHLPWIRTLVAA